MTLFSLLNVNCSTTNCNANGLSTRCIRTLENNSRHINILILLTHLERPYLRRLSILILRRLRLTVREGPINVCIPRARRSKGRRSLIIRMEYVVCFLCRRSLTINEDCRRFLNVFRIRRSSETSMRIRRSAVCCARSRGRYPRECLIIGNRPRCYYSDRRYCATRRRLINTLAIGSCLF